MHDGATNTAWVEVRSVGDLHAINRRTKLRVAELGHSKVLLLKRRARAPPERFLAKASPVLISNTSPAGVGHSDSHSDSTVLKCFRDFVVVFGLTCPILADQ